MKQVNNDNHSRHAKENVGKPTRPQCYKENHKQQRDAKRDEVGMGRGDSVEEENVGQDGWN